jgi:hypothetical protein
LSGDWGFLSCLFLIHFGFILVGRELLFCQVEWIWFGVGFFWLDSFHANFLQVKPTVFYFSPSTTPCSESSKIYKNKAEENFTECFCRSIINHFIALCFQIISKIVPEASFRIISKYLWKWDLKLSS